MNHTIGTKIVVDVETCKLQCYYEHNCVSVNYHVNTKTCELNNATHRWHDNEFKNEDNYLYHGADVRFFLIFIIANPLPHISVLFLEFVLLFSSSRSLFLSCLCSCSCSCSFSRLCSCSSSCLCLCLCPCSCSSSCSCLCSCLHVRACVLASCCSSSFATTLNLFLISFSYHFLVTNFIWARICSTIST